jgi:sulfide:quinone oxidoreductase
MKVLELAPEVFVCGQLYEHDVRLAAKQRVRSIVNNRDDGETPGQPLSADLARVAEEEGVTFVHFPVHPKAITDEVIAEFAKTCGALQRPLLIFSRTGARSTKIWEQAEDLIL